MLEAPSLTVDKSIPIKSKCLQKNLGPDHPQLRIVASVTPPIQAPYLLKCIPDRVTDDTGAMVSDYVLRMNKYRPQEGRWISRTVLNHAGYRMFRCTHQRMLWALQVLIADDLENHRMTWEISSGEIFTIQMPIEQLNWERHLEFTLKNTPKGKSARLLNGRKLQYQVKEAKAEEEEGFVTLVRYTPQCPQGKATALFNWKVSAMEFLPEEDALLVLLLCNATVRTVADFGGDSVGDFFIKRRKKETTPGKRDWGSVVVQNSVSASDLSFWYLNPREVLGIPGVDEKPSRLNSEEQVHVYTSGSWLFMDGGA
ncbi:hypothetical protein KI387_009996 [Taxus chinensis]|uniref:GRPD C-terminal domain-containing protein n=1 Tax=Taxus chinensis TaxID=29808 RepID=A0AA38FKC7_TAXCH|nr:hypothetical protein KI387_009996 [Taxus chinensis]